jgi:hypothetical protein
MYCRRDEERIKKEQRRGFEDRYRRGCGLPDVDKLWTAAAWPLKDCEARARSLTSGGRNITDHFEFSAI